MSDKRKRLEWALAEVDVVLLADDPTDEDFQRICESAVPTLADFTRVCLQLVPSEENDE